MLIAYDKTMTVKNYAEAKKKAVVSESNYYSILLLLVTQLFGSVWDNFFLATTN